MEWDIERTLNSSTIECRRCHWTGHYEARETHTSCHGSNSTTTEIEAGADSTATDGLQASPLQQPDHDIDEGFRLLETNLQGALAKAEALLTKDSGDYSRAAELKARALLAIDHNIKAITHFQPLYTNSVTFNDQKNNGLALGKHLQLMGGMDNLKTALDIYARLRCQAARGMANTPCDDVDIELALARVYVFMGYTDKSEGIFTRLYGGGRIGLRF
ncbi:hypothetical protein [Sansalvadorimonas verongulae]|uniref:hypothetical protein n=1 Tax=Sansalvadorimonas verongulae TaxID=2172824 RepID=UPI0012BBA7B0|nr:hypothetical protein [Sansalvadorimonas verongulae]MTI14093.1 hypothetical protein [Sansalvadorimonas verongulae]